MWRIKHSDCPPRHDGARLAPTENNSRPHTETAMLKTVTFTLMHFCIAFSVTYALTGSAAAG